MFPTTQTTFIANPPVPYLGGIPGGSLKPGQMVIIDGTVLPNAFRFEINLACGRSFGHPHSDIALHFNPRFDMNQIVRNTYSRQAWGAEERLGAMTFVRTQPFRIQILVECARYMVAVNGQHFCEFAHRIPISMVNTLQIKGDVTVRGITFLAGSIYPPPPEPSMFPSPHDHSHSHHDSHPHGHHHGHHHQHVKSPHVPYTGDIPGNMNVGKEIEVKGKVKMLPHRFYINLQQGRQRHPHPIIAFHFNPRFEGSNVVVRNAYINGWGHEERMSSGFPFRPHHEFSIQILCESTHFSVAVDNLPFTTFKHRIPPHKTDTIHIEGDVHIEDIYIR